MLGENEYGQLGLGSTGDKGDGTTEMGDNLSYVDLGDGIHVLQVSLGSQHTCALLDNYSTTDIDYTVKCWGDETTMQLLDKDTMRIGVIIVEKWEITSSIQT